MTPISNTNTTASQAQTVLFCWLHYAYILTFSFYLSYQLLKLQWRESRRLVLSRTSCWYIYIRGQYIDISMVLPTTSHYLLKENLPFDFPCYSIVLLMEDLRPVFSELKHSYILGGIACSFIHLHYIYTHRELAPDFMQLCYKSTGDLPLASPDCNIFIQNKQMVWA
jgi:hypothetical protein